MIVLPWFIRFALDCTISLTPIIYFHNHPTTHLFEYFQNRRRLVRRKDIDQFKRVDRESETSVEQAKKIYKELGIQL